MKALLLFGLGAAVATATAGDFTAPIAPSDNAIGCGLVGDFTVGFGYTHLGGSEIRGSEEDEFASANVELQLGRNFGDYFVQADFFGELADVGNHDDSYDSGYGAAIHIMRRNESRGLGIFAGGLATEQDNDNMNSSERWFAGVEAQLFQEEIDYYLQLGALWGTGGDDSNGTDSIRDAIFVHCTALKDLQNGLSLSGNLGGAWGKMDSDSDDLALYTVGVALTKPLNDQQAISLGYQFTYYDQGGGEDDTMSEHFLGFNFTYAFDSGSISERNRNSTSLGTPGFLRWTGITGGQLE